MDGLECSEKNLSIVASTTTLRLDSDYYKKEYLNIENIILDRNCNFTTIESMGLTVNASAFYPSLEPYYNTGEIPFIRVADVKTQINYEDCVRIPKMNSDFNTLYLCKKGDIVLTKGGSVGNVGLITQDSYVTRDLIFINSSVLERADYITLYLFFSSNFMYKQMIKSSSYSVQPHLTITLIRELLMYQYSNSFKKIVSFVFEQSEKKIGLSKQAYCQAEQLLLTALGIADFTPSSEPVAVKSFSESFSTSGRLDAEFYQPKYDDYKKLLKTSDTVLSLCNLHDKNFNPHNDVEYRYIELSNVGTSGNISDVETVIGKELPSRARRKVKAGQIIVASVEGSLQSCALITEEYNNVLCSNGFYVLDADSINSETLLVLFKSEPIQAMLKQRCSGTILTAISKDELLDVPFPMVDGNVQKQIASKVQESFALRRKSEQLLEYAKSAVEMAIEQGEEKAMEWLKEKGVEG